MIPSHENYPADEKNHLAEAATTLLGKKILDVASNDPGDHASFGVVDPSSKDVKPGSIGVGSLVIMKDKAGKMLLSVIIGTAAPDKPDLRYVRRSDEDAVYVVEMKTDKLSTNFGDWIEKDLLKMNTWDLKQVWIRDYSVNALRGEVQQNDDMNVSYDDAAEPKWKLIRDEKFKGDKFMPVKLAPDEELNTAKLDEMKTALEDLKIVDVRRKPQGLSADLKAAASFISNSEAVQSLASRGFYAAKVEGQVELLSNEGEVHYLMKDGVEYVLRFGSVAAGTDTAKKDAKKGPKKDAAAGLNRYLLVMTDFNPDAIAKPMLEPLPSENTAKKPAGEPAPSATRKRGEPEASASGKKPAKSDAPKKDEKKPADIKAERDRITKENKRKQDEYDEQVAKGKARVKELNTRFADWYYVISDEVYRKIHLTRNQAIKKKSPKGANGEAFHEHGDHDHGDHEHADHDHDHGDDEDGHDHHDHDHDQDPAAADEPSTPRKNLEELKKEGLEGKK